MLPGADDEDEECEGVDDDERWEFPLPPPSPPRCEEEPLGLPVISP
ncbi:hypothetical protein LV78_007778 [Actinosynnema pretiosum]|nr:hypothetical protein [Actinosynnema pretiosum]